MTKQDRQLRIGILGSGIFVRDAHLPALLALTEQARVTAIWSRTRANAQAIADVVAAQTGSAPAVEDDISALVSRPDVDIVDVVLPIDNLADGVRAALAAGKHVISEKPIARNLAEARALVEEWRATDLHWMVAENIRYESVFMRAAELLRDGSIGKPLTLSWAMQSPVTADVKYYHTPWRRAGDLQGGFLLDSGVHHIAALRMILGEVETVQAFVTQNSPDLPPVDTIAASLRFANGVLGSYVSSFAKAQAAASPLLIVGTEGALRVQRNYSIELTRGDDTQTFNPADGSSVGEELAAFLHTLTNGTPNRNAPEEALRDLAVVEAMLESARIGSTVAVAHA